MSYDWVKFTTECPICKKQVGGFQTKDIFCSLEEVEFWQCDYFYSMCDYCNAWVEFKLKKPRQKLSIKDYEMRVHLNEVPEDHILRTSEGRIYGYGSKK